MNTKTIEIDKNMIVHQYTTIQENLDLNMFFFFVVDIDQEIQIVENIELSVTNRFNVWMDLEDITIKLDKY